VQTIVHVENRTNGAFFAIQDSRRSVIWDTCVVRDTKGNQCRGRKYAGLKSTSISMERQIAIVGSRAFGFLPSDIQSGRKGERFQPKHDGSRVRSPPGLRALRYNTPFEPHSVIRQKRARRSST
jgi:hypothetical protein